MCRGHRSFGGAVPDYSAGFSLPMPDAETSISEEPGARKGHAGICAGAARATGRPTAMCAVGPERAVLCAVSESCGGSSYTRMQAIDLVRDYLKKSWDRVLTRVDGR